MRTINSNQSDVRAHRRRVPLNATSELEKCIDLSLLIYRAQDENRVCGSWQGRVLNVPRQPPPIPLPIGPMDDVIPMEVFWPTFDVKYSHGGDVNCSS